MAKCVYCGHYQQPFEHFDKYGFCESCKRKVRQQIKDSLATCNEFLEFVNSTDIDSLNDASLVDQFLNAVTKKISLLDELELMREQAPMFKSSLDHFYSAFFEATEKLKNRKRFLESSEPTESVLFSNDAQLKQKLNELQTSTNKQVARLKGEYNKSITAQSVSYNTGRPAFPKNKWIALLLCVFLGCFGVHKFYEGNLGMGILYIFTGGICGIGVIADILLLIFKPNPYFV